MDRWNAIRGDHLQTLCAFHTLRKRRHLSTTLGASPFQHQVDASPDHKAWTYSAAVSFEMYNVKKKREKSERFSVISRDANPKKIQYTACKREAQKRIKTIAHEECAFSRTFAERMTKSTTSLRVVGMPFGSSAKFLVILRKLSKPPRDIFPAGESIPNKQTKVGA